MENKLFEGTTLIFDVDDTICNNKNRDYENAIPYVETIDKINYLYDNGAKIILYTSRGMISCNGDLAKIIKEKEPTLKRWLEKNNVKYNELIFGKPIGDLYVDDKAINVADFNKQKFCRLNGHSGYSVLRLGNIVKKSMSDANYIKVKDWYEYSKGIANSPRLISNVYSTVYLEFIEGKNANECLTEELLDKVIEQILKFKDVKIEGFDNTKLIDKLNTHKSEDEEWNKTIDECISMIKELNIEKYASLSHGDMTLANMVVKDDKIYLLDSLFQKEASSYLLDFAKFKMSLDGYETMFCNGPVVDNKYLELYKNKLQELGILKEVTILEYMYIIRLYNYNDDKEKVKQFASRIRGEIEW